jgi:hypothetical protein
MMQWYHVGGVEPAARSPFVPVRSAAAGAPHSIACGSPRPGRLGLPAPKTKRPAGGGAAAGSNYRIVPECEP